jgi:hypothetical protein
MRNYLFYGLLAALIMPVAASADDWHHDHERGHDHDREHHEWHYYNGHEWHRHHHIYSDNYYMEVPRPVYVAPAPVYVEPAPYYQASPSLNITIPIH